ncbi:MAG: META domain-containing protein [Flavobacteriales bacterium]|nr:META domain-containing protein [Flavobacteriales bacterium]
MKKILKFILIAVSLFACTSKSTVSGDTKSISPQEFKDKYWKLIELNSKPIENNQMKEPHLIISSAENRINGSGGCNSFFGEYELFSENGIRFSQMGSTKMACHNDTIEDDFFKMMSEVNEFSIDGDKLLLKKSKEIVAIFQWDKAKK